MVDFSLLPMAIRDTSHPLYDVWAAFVKLSDEWELNKFEAKIAWEFFRAGTIGSDYNRRLKCLLK